MFDEVISNSTPPCSLSLRIYNLMDSLLPPFQKKYLFPIFRGAMFGCQGHLGLSACRIFVLQDNFQNYHLPLHNFDAA